MDKLAMEFFDKNYNGDDKLRGDIQSLIENNLITLESLSKIIGIDYLWLKDYMDKKNSFKDFYTNSMYSCENQKDKLNDLPILTPSSLSNLIFMLSNGISMINEDERIKGVIDVLVDDFKISYKTLAIYSKLELEDIQSFIKDGNSISYEKKYKLAVATLFLHYLFKKSPDIRVHKD
ncbi:hypothetical protein CKR_0597 [Clostridium kluyveri NBRC 12016]|nr:hypothetical protein CKR_0597 [Clostridium kluyveri NBRC 12016]